MSIEHLISYQPQMLQWRRRLLVIVMALLAAAIVVRIVVVGIVERDRWQALAEQQYRATIPISGERGTLRDRTGRVLATAVPTVSLALDPKMVRSAATIAHAVERIGITSAAELLARIAASKDRNFVWIARGIPMELAAALDTINDPGLIRLRELQRTYVLDSLAAQLLGTTDVDGRGIAGIELEYDTLLRGTTGVRSMERIGRGRLRPMLDDRTSTARPGASIELTLDADLQQIAEQELARSVSSTGAAAGIVLVLNPTTGELLACAHQPAYSHTRRNTTDALRLRAVTDMYEPGSTFKAIVAAAALAEGRAWPDRLFDGHGGTLRTTDGRTITDHEPLGWCTLTDALAHSSNIVFAELARQLGARTLYRYARDFGFGIRTEIELPGEARGVLRLPRQLDPGDLLFMGFGYGIACTPLQLACAYAALANDGTLMKPYVVRRILAANGDLIEEHVPQRIRQVIPPTVAQQVRSMLQQVVERGTGTNARIEGIPIAGKTGTAQQWVEGSYSKRDYTASFVGMVPATKPALVIVTMLDRPRSDIYGGSTAAPLFRRIVEAMMGVPSLTARYGFFHQQRSSHASDSVVVPDVRGLTCVQAQKVFDALHLRCNVIRSERCIVTFQTPAPGSLVKRQSSVTLTTAVPDTLKQLPLVGLPARNAVGFCHLLGIPVVVHGRGRVRSYRWETLGRQQRVILFTDERRCFDCIH